MVRKRLTKIHGPLNRSARKRPTAEEKRAARLNRQRNKEKLVSDSLKCMKNRGVAILRKQSSPCRTMKRFRNLYPDCEEVSQIQIKSLYPPDHWMHSPSDFDRSLSMRFERDWLWVRGGGAISKTRYRPSTMRKLLDLEN
tara:strand:+ start:225 stop:644 length:420 start_codon:yes stop_codon:yes gene_type:complete